MERHTENENLSRAIAVFEQACSRGCVCTVLPYFRTLFQMKIWMLGIPGLHIAASIPFLRIPREKIPPQVSSRPRPQMYDGLDYDRQSGVADGFDDKSVSKSVDCPSSVDMGPCGANIRESRQTKERMNARNPASWFSHYDISNVPCTETPSKTNICSGLATGLI